MKKLLKKFKQKPMIILGRLATKGLVFVHLLDNLLVVLLSYNNDEFMLTTLIYLVTSNMVVFWALDRLGGD